MLGCCITGIRDDFERPSIRYRVMGSVRAPETSMRPGNTPGLSIHTFDSNYQHGDVGTESCDLDRGATVSGSTVYRHLIESSCSRKIGKNRNFVPRLRVVRCAMVTYFPWWTTSNPCSSNRL